MAPRSRSFVEFGEIRKSGQTVKGKRVMLVYRNLRRARQGRKWFWFTVGLFFGLAGCGSEIAPTGTTHASYSRSPDGTESVAIHDGKDRGSFSAMVTKPDGTNFTLQSSDSNGSTAQANAMAAQADAINKLLGLVQSGALLAVKHP